ncbi:MAG TPA: cytochrome c-type biogenesis protein CcmH [Gemmatimonadaceae bacterium]|nr:cytochrome c-type biogenesis protein CcmH [Gemmatimonadaceae bacterium]
MQSRRQFVAAVVGGAATFAARSALSQQTAPTMSGPMEQDAYRPVKLSAKPGAPPSMTDEQRDDLEHQIKCQCGCVLDVYTCRTTDFSCAVSPAMHADVMGLVSGGYIATEILGAFQSVYGERVLMSPLKQGFNWVGYLMPFAVILTSGTVAAVLIRRWKAQSERVIAANASISDQAPTVDATPAELEALTAAVRDDR